MMLSLDTAYRSFSGEVGASSTPTICRLSDSSRHQLSAIALLQHWRHHKFSGVRPFFCQVEAAETAIWLTEVAPQLARGKRVLDHLAAANKDANPELMRLAL